VKLQGQVALVTGGSRSIGRAIARAFAREGANVAVNYVKNTEAAESAVREIKSLGRQALAVQGDTSQRSQVHAMVEAVEERLGPIDVLVNNAGVLRRVYLLDLEEADWDAVLGVNLKGCFLVGQAVAARMKERGKGKIINIASDGGGFPAPRMSAYCVSKAGLIMLTKCMALELAQYGIRVNALAPGMTKTDINRKDLEDEAFLKARLLRIPLGRILSPEDLVGAAVFLASTDSDMMTGMVLQVDGGRSIA